MFRYSHNSIFEHFNNINRNKIIAVLHELSDNEYIRYIVADDYEMGMIFLLSCGMLYFDNKEVETHSTTNVINYGSFNNSVIGNNNSVDFNITQNTDFKDVFMLIENLQNDNKAIMLELVKTLQDCIENSKPLPKGNSARYWNIQKTCSPFSLKSVL